MKKINFKNKPNSDTPLSAENLNLLQDNIEEEVENLLNLSIVTNSRIGRINKYDGTTTANPDNFMGLIQITNHNKVPTGSGYWYIVTFVFDRNGISNRTQIALPYLGVNNGIVYTRTIYEEIVYPWVKLGGVANLLSKVKNYFSKMLGGVAHVYKENMVQ